MYMYSYDGIGKVILKSLIEQQAVEGKNNKYKVHLFNDVSEVKNRGNVADFILVSMKRKDLSEPICFITRL